MLLKYDRSGYNMDKLKILVIEDSKTFNNFISTLLQQYRYEVIQSYSLKESKFFLSNSNFDFILLDLNLPDAQGEYLIDSIKEITNTKIIVMTGDENTNQRDEYFQKGIIDYFIKTTPIQIIASNIHSLIQTINNSRNSNILTIDDSSFVRNLLKNVLTQKGYNVYAASNVEDGLEILNKYKVQLILLDLIMPNIDGINFLEIIKEDPNYFDIPVIVVSGDSSRDNYARVLKNGASDFIKKPFIIEEVLLKCDVHIKSYIQGKKIIESQKEMAKQKSISKLLENIAHHWRQPLSVISTNASSIMIENEYKINSEISIDTRMKQILEYTKLLSNTIEDFRLLFSKGFIPEIVVVDEFIDSLLGTYIEYIKSNNIKVIKNIQVESFYGFGDQLKQILTLLINNIKEHAINNKYIFISIKEIDDNIQIIVKDNGGGAPDEIIENIFEPYFTTKHQSFGKGVGLYVVYQIITEEFNGSIKARNAQFLQDNKAHKGLEFTITIPIIED
jgi:DNA-binding response OmpR family regulator